MDTMRNEMPNTAADWDARLRMPGCSAAERAAFKRWCGTSLENQDAFDELQAMLSELRAARAAPLIRSLREDAVNAAPLDSARNWRASAWATAAVVGMVAVGLAYIGVNTPVGPVNERMPSYTTAIGERSTTSFEDGTVAMLNTNTQLEVRYTDDERRVTLLQGQALFDVAKDVARPFVVIAGDQRITAIGTVFDVRFEGGEVQVTLVEGVVDIATNPISGNLAVSRMKQKSARLVAGQQLITTAVATPSAPRVHSVNVENATIWQQGRVFFEDAPLSTAVAEMNRYSRTQIIVDDAALDRYRVNGMFRTGQQANFIEALEQYFPLEAAPIGGNQLVLRAK